MSVLLIDDREDGRIPAELHRFPDVPSSVVRLDYADAAFSGCGPAGPLLVGFEHKRLTDLIACMKDRRLAGSQLVGMWQTYDRVEIVVEGIFRPTPAGTIEYMNGDRAWHPLYFKREGITYAQVDGYLQSLSECGDVRIWRTSSYVETAHLYASRFRWWQKRYDLHRSHDAIYSNDPEAQRRGKLVVHRGTPNAVCQFAAQIPGIDAKAWDIGEQYGSIFESVVGRPMTEVEAREGVERWHRTTWTDASGKVKRFGRKTAQAIVDYLRGK